ncbi:MAG: potassium transporter Kup, partial [Planctomycetota bacterium]
VGSIFGPVTIVSFATLAVLGVGGIVRAPQVLLAVNPAYALGFLLENHTIGFLALGSVFLVVTGAETLYADMGHFGHRPIRLAWYGLVLPSLLLNYFGQGAILLDDPAKVSNPFYALAPSWAHYPLVLLATAATIIASQAVISGAFSLTRQAVALGYCPRLRIRHTSSQEIGQIYVPAVNWVLMASTIVLVLAFRSSGKLAAAYGVAVTTTMIITTLLFYVVARERWKWSWWQAGLPTALFLLVDVSFFGANIGKVAHGAWFPLAIGLVAFTFLSTWKRGRDVLASRYRTRAVSVKDLLADLRRKPPPRAPGRAVYMTSNPDGVPPTLLLNLAHNDVLHEEVVFLTLVTESVPRVARGRRIELKHLGSGIHRLVGHYGFQETPDVPRLLGAAKTHGLELTMADTTFFLGKENVLPRKKSGMPAWRAWLFGLMVRNTLSATDYYKLPPDRVLELGAQVEL